MNAYIVVEGEKTEMSVYPAWLSIIAPKMHRIDDARDLTNRNLKYDKNDTSEVCKPEYLNELIARYNETSHLLTFGSWYNFVKEKMSK